MLFFGMFINSSCGDDPITPDQRKIELSFTGLRPLNQQTDGVYEAWLSVETSLDHDDGSFRSAGRFNISASGQIVDTAGNPAGLNLNKIGDINLTEDALITIEQPGDNDTLPGIRMLGGAKSVQGSVIVFNMSMGYHEVLPISSQFSAATGKYMLASPTMNFASFSPNLGIWFSLDTNGISPGLTLPVLPDTAEWTYQAWVIDMRDSANRVYNAGRFTSSTGTDDYSQCKGTLPVWNLPGNDWVLTDCPAGMFGIDNLNNGNFKVLVSLEPKAETNGLPYPFFISIFYNTIASGGFGTTSDAVNTTSLPSAVIRLSVN